MHGEIITIGNELTFGEVMNINGWYVSKRLSHCGYEVTHITAIRDNPEEIKHLLALALSRSDFIIITGGLGSTEDDLTTEVVASYLGQSRVIHKGLLARIHLFVEKLGLPWNASYEKMAWIPEGADLLDPEARALGYCLEQGKAIFFFIPGVPKEVSIMLERWILPILKMREKHPQTILQKTLKVFGLQEPEINERLKDLHPENENVAIGFYPNFPLHHVVLTVRGAEEKRVKERLSRWEKKVVSRLGKHVVARNASTMESEIGDLLRKNRLTIALAESITGGLIGHLLTKVPGSSDYLDRGMTVYSNRAKTELLGVPESLFARYGAVSKPVAEAMAKGAMEKSGTGLGLAVTGIAGPAGGSARKPVGTVFIALAWEKGVHSQKFWYPGKRDQVKILTAYSALEMLRRYLLNDFSRKR